MKLNVPFYSQVKDIKKASWKQEGCGVACLKMVLNFYTPLNLELDHLFNLGIKQQAYSKKVGWYHLGLVRMSQIFGFSGHLQSFFEDKNLKLGLETIKQKLQSNQPVIASVKKDFIPNNPGHLVILTGFNKTGFFVNDPYDQLKNGKNIKISFEKFTKAWSRRIISIYPKTNVSEVSAVVLAAGKGTRMNSNTHKVLHTINNKPLILHTLEKLESLNFKQLLTVVGHKSADIIQVLGQNRSYVHQKKLLGTGHAVTTILPYLNSKSKTVVVLTGDDSAFYKPETLKNTLKKHQDSKAKMTILTVDKKDVDVSGRVLRDSRGRITAIKPNSGFSPLELKQQNEIVCGFFVFEKDWLLKELPKIKLMQSGEYPLTGLITTALNQGCLLGVKLEDQNEWQSVNTQRELEKARKLAKLI